jgi:hypothetical protein
MLQQTPCGRREQEAIPRARRVHWTGAVPGGRGTEPRSPKRSSCRAEAETRRYSRFCPNDEILARYYKMMPCGHHEKIGNGRIRFCGLPRKNPFSQSRFSQTKGHFTGKVLCKRGDGRSIRTTGRRRRSHGIHMFGGPGPPLNSPGQRRAGHLGPPARLKHVLYSRSYVGLAPLQTEASP